MHTRKNREQKDPRIGEESSESETSDASSEEAGLSASENEEKALEEHNEKRLAAFLETIKPAYDEILVAQRPQEYYEAQKLIRVLSRFAPSDDKDAIRAAYFKRLDKCEDSIPKLKTFILSLKQLVLAARATGAERSRLLLQIEEYIREINLLETGNLYIKSQNAIKYSRKAESTFDNDKLRLLYFTLQAECEDIKQQKAAAVKSTPKLNVAGEERSDCSGRSRSRESDREPSRSPSPLGSHGVFSESTATQQASERALGTETGPLPPRPRPAARSRSA